MSTVLTRRFSECLTSSEGSWYLFRTTCAAYSSNVSLRTLQPRIWRFSFQMSARSSPDYSKGCEANSPSTGGSSPSTSIHRPVRATRSKRRVGHLRGTRVYRAVEERGRQVVRGTHQIVSPAAAHRQQRARKRALCLVHRRMGLISLEGSPCKRMILSLHDRLPLDVLQGLPMAYNGLDQHLCRTQQSFLHRPSPLLPKTPYLFLDLHRSTLPCQAMSPVSRFPINLARHPRLRPLLLLLTMCRARFSVVKIPQHHAYPSHQSSLTPCPQFKAPWLHSSRAT